MSRLQVALILSSLALVPACTSLQSVSLTQIPADRTRPVKAEVSNSALFGIHFTNSFVDELTESLRRQCPNGRLTGLLTKQENTSYFVIATRHVVSTGYCVYDPPAMENPVRSAQPEVSPSRPSAVVSSIVASSAKGG